MSYCDWDILLDGMEWQTIKDFCKKPTAKDPYYRVIEAFKEYLTLLKDERRTSFRINVCGRARGPSSNRPSFRMTRERLSATQAPYIRWIGTLFAH
jgi:hypothetical protein